jgi:hypothetical protein
MFIYCYIPTLSFRDQLIESPRFQRFQCQRMSVIASAKKGRCQRKVVFFLHFYPRLCPSIHQIHMALAARLIVL